MSAYRENVMNALLALLQSRCGATFQTYSRRFVTWERLIQALTNGTVVPPMPALYLYDGMGLGGGLDHWDPRGRASPAVVTLHRTVVIYATLPNGDSAQGQDGATPGGSVFHPLIESVESALDYHDSTQQNTLTLGGLVSHCWLEGDGMMMTGELDDIRGQGMLTMPIKIMLYPTSQ
jgi:hypothetical protein